MGRWWIVIVTGMWLITLACGDTPHPVLEATPVYREPPGGYSPSTRSAPSDGTVPELPLDSPQNSDSRDGHAESTAAVPDPTADAGPQHDAQRPFAAPLKASDAGSLTPDAGTLEDDASALATAPGSCPLDQGLTPGEHEFVLHSQNGLTYTYTAVVPDTIERGQRVPLAIVWHGFLSNPAETRGLTTMDMAAAEAGMITVHPQSPDTSWDTGTCCSRIAAAPVRDEVIFVRELVEALQQKLCVDPKRIYAAGFSNGGMLTNLVACELDDIFAAFAPMAATLTVPPETCSPTRAVPIFMVNGTADPLVGYEATGLSGGLPVTATFEFWADRNDCAGQPEITYERGDARCESYSHCRDGAEVTLCTVEGMGHCLPSMEQESALNCLTKLIPLGPPSADMDGVSATLQFLQRFTLP